MCPSWTSLMCCLRSLYFFPQIGHGVRHWKCKLWSSGTKSSWSYSKPYHGHLWCASQDLSSDNSCSHSHRTCISSAEVHELGLWWLARVKILRQKLIFFVMKNFYLTMLLVYVVLQVREFSVETNVQHQTSSKWSQVYLDRFGLFWIMKQTRFDKIFQRESDEGDFK